MIKHHRLTTFEALIETSFELLNKNPNTSLAEIALKAGVGRATLHRHFTGRQDLIFVLAKRAIDEMDNAADLASKNSCSYINPAA